MSDIVSPPLFIVVVLLLCVLCASPPTCLCTLLQCCTKVYTYYYSYLVQVLLCYRSLYYASGYRRVFFTFFLSVDIKAQPTMVRADVPILLLYVVLIVLVVSINSMMRSQNCDTASREILLRVY